MSNKIFLVMSALLVGFALLSWGTYLRSEAEILASHQRSQVLLARQSAKTLETLFTGHSTGDPVAVGSLLQQAASTLPAELVELGLFDRHAGKMLHVPPALPGAEDLPELRERLSRGGFGSMVLEHGEEESLVSFLPLSLGEGNFSLLVCSPLRPNAGLFMRPLTLAGAQSALALMLAFGVGWSRFRIHSGLKVSAAGPEEPAAAGQPRSESEYRSEALRLENLSLQARLWDYQLLVDNADYGMARLSGNGQIQFSSTPFQKLMGGRGRELKGRNLLDLETFDKAMRQRLQEAIGGLRDGGTAVTLLADLAPHPEGGDTTLVSLRLFRLQGNEAANGLLLTAHPVPAEDALPQVSAS